MTSNQKKAKKNLLYSFIGQITTITIGLLLPRLFIIGYGSEVNGLLSSINQFLIYLGLFEAGIGATTLQALYKPIATDNKEQICGIVNATNDRYRKTGKFYLITLVCFSLFYPLIVNCSLPYISVVAIILFSGLGNVIVFFFHGKYRILLQAEGKNYIITNLTTIVSIVTGFSKILLVYFNVNIVVILFISFIIHLLQCVYIMIYIKKHYSWLDQNIKSDYEAISKQGYVIVHQIAGMVFQNTDVLILTIVCGLKTVSVYSLYKLIISHLESILSIFVNSFNFALGQLYHIDKINFEKKFNAFEVAYSAMAVVLFSVAFSLILPFMELYTQGVTDIKYCDIRLTFLFVVIALFTAIRTPGLQIINYAGYFKETLPQTIIETVINIVISIVTSFFWGIYGVLLGTLSALIYRYFDVISCSNKIILSRSPKKSFWVHLICVLVGLVTQFIYMLFSNQINTYFDFFIVGIMDFLFTGILMLIVCYIVFCDFRKTIKEIIRKKSTQV